MPVPILTWTDSADAVELKDVVNVARDIFKPEKLNLAVIGPYRDETMFSKLLKVNL